MTNKTRLVLLYGGNSGEHEISLISAAGVLQQLKSTSYAITPIGIDKQGRCFQNNYQELLSHKKSLPVRTKQSVPLDSLLVQGKFALPTDVVFPMVHGPLYEDGALQGVLSLAGIPFVGCGVLASALGMNKAMSRAILNSASIRTVPCEVLSYHASQSSKDDFCAHVINQYKFPLFVKPQNLGSSVGIHKVETLEDLKDAIADAFSFDDEVIVEPCIQGRELELAVLENANTGKPDVSLPGEISVSHPDGYYSYAAKYIDTDTTVLHVPAELDQELITHLQQTAATIFTTLGCQGLSRVDFFLEDGTGDLYFNEVNTLPGFTPMSMYPKLWEGSGLPYSDLLDRLIENAITRHKHRATLVTSYQ